MTRTARNCQPILMRVELSLFFITIMMNNMTTVTYGDVAADSSGSVRNSNSNSEPNSAPLSSRTVRTKYGDVSGVIVSLDSRHLEPVEVFRGIPYASPPTGSLRFMPPVSGALWSGVKIADKFSPVCPQRLPDIKNETAALKKMPKGRLEYLKRLLPHLQNQSEDCLYLNIYAPVQDSQGVAKKIKQDLPDDNFSKTSGENSNDNSLESGLSQVKSVQTEESENFIMNETYKINKQIYEKFDPDTLSGKNDNDLGNSLGITSDDTDNELNKAIIKLTSEKSLDVCSESHNPIQGIGFSTPISGSVILDLDLPVMTIEDISDIFNQNRSTENSRSGLTNQLELLKNDDP